MKKQLISAILIILILFTQADVSTLAGNAYREIVKVSTTALAATEVSIDSEKELIAALYTGLLDREDKIVVKYAIPGYKLNLDELYQKVIAIDDKSIAKDGDYLAYSMRGWEAVTRTGWNSTTLNFAPSYKTTLEEEDTVDSKVKSVLKGLKLEGASDYKKVKAIHDYIIKRVSYDTTLVKTSAYDAMINKSTVCEGYSMLAYRLFTEAGLKSRIISGTGNGGAHAWNIVKVKDKWYNIDLTWDDPISSDGKPMLTYDYFLKSTKDFTGHKRDAEYKTDEFVKSYPISKTSYKMQ
jgi:hypothetical protein